MTLRIAIAADHAGFELKTTIKEWLLTTGHEIIDLGAERYDKNDDYPDYGRAVGESVRNGQTDRGIIFCGSGVGACVAANKIKGIRACVCHDTYTARQGVEHDNLNVICLGEKVIGIETAREVITAFLLAGYQPLERYERRLNKIAELESRNL